MGKPTPKPPDGLTIILEYLQWRNAANKAALAGDTTEVKRLLEEFDTKLHEFRRMIDAE